MANKKRDRNGYKNELGRYRLGYDDIIAIEKILRQYADTYESSRASKYGKPTTPPPGRKHMPRVFADMNIKVGRYRPFHITLARDYLGVHHAGVDWIYDADSVKFLPQSLRRRHYVQVECKPGISVTFTPLSTSIYAQTHYATGMELKVMKECVKKIEQYILSRESSWLNVIALRKG